MSGTAEPLSERLHVQSERKEMCWCETIILFSLIKYYLQFLVISLEKILNEVLFGLAIHNNDKVNVYEKHG